MDKPATQAWGVSAKSARKLTQSLNVNSTDSGERFVLGFYSILYVIVIVMDALEEGYLAQVVTTLY